MTSFNTFVAKKYQAKPEKMKEVYGSLEAFRSMYAASNGLSEWFDSLRGQSISLGLTNNIAKTFILESRRIPEEIPSLLSSLSRQYDIELPVVEGILTRDYWIDKAKQLGWALEAKQKERLISA